MKHSAILLFILLAIASLGVFGQGASLNASGAPPDPSAMMDISSTIKGTLFTRMTTAQRDSIVSPAKGLEIYNTDCDNFNYNAGTATSPNWVSANPPVDLPAAAGNISGTATVCQGQNSVSYSVPAITNATSYIWSYSGAGATFSGSTNPVTVSFSGAATLGNLSVMGSNVCGNGTVSANYAITVDPIPAAPIAASNTPSQTQIVWNWNSVSGAIGYKWNTINDYSSATDAGTNTTYTQTELSCNTSYNLYVWAYNTGCNSAAAILTQTTSSCCSPAITLDHYVAHNYGSSTDNFTINTSSANEIITISVNACCTGGFNGTLTVDGNAGTLITQVFGAQSSPQAWTAVYAWVVTNSGSHNISLTWGSNVQNYGGWLCVAYVASYAGFCSAPTIAGNLQSASAQFGQNNSECTSSACITGTATITPAAANSCLFGNFWMNFYSTPGSSFTWTNASYLTSNREGTGMDGSIGYNNYAGTSAITVSATDNGAGNNYNNGIFILLDIHP